MREQALRCDCVSHRTIFARLRKIPHSNASVPRGEVYSKCGPLLPFAKTLAISVLFFVANHLPDPTRTSTQSRLLLIVPHNPAAPGASKIKKNPLVPLTQTAQGSGVMVARQHHTARFAIVTHYKYNNALVSTSNPVIQHNAYSVASAQRNTLCTTPLETNANQELCITKAIRK